MCKILGSILWVKYLIPIYWFNIKVSCIGQKVKVTSIGHLLMSHLFVKWKDVICQPKVKVPIIGQILMSHLLVKSQGTMYWLIVKVPSSDQILGSYLLVKC